MNAERVKITIDGFDVTVEVEGVEGPRCMDMTKFMETMKGATITDQQLKVEYRKIPTEVRV